jgi:lipopolysaccharide export system permease protein
MLGPLLFGVAAFVCILMAGGPLLKFVNYAFDGVPIPKLVYLFFLSLPPLIVVSLPMSMLIAALLGFGRLSNDSELTAMYAGGLSLWRIMLPILLLATFVSLVAVVFNERVVPWTVDEAYRMKESIGKGVREQRQIELPQYLNDRIVARVYADSFDPATKELKGVSAVFFDERSRVSRVASAPKAVYADDNNWTLYDATVHEIRPDQPAPSAHFREYRLRLLQPPSRIVDVGKKVADMSMRELRQTITYNNEYALPTSELWTAWWNRLSMPFAAVVFTLTGIPLAIRRSRTSSGLGFGVSIVIIFLYWLLWSYTTKLGNYGQLPPFVAAWFANGVGAVLGVVLLARAPK